MGDLKARLKPLFRRSSTLSSPKSPKSPKTSVFEAAPTGDSSTDGHSLTKTSIRLKNKKSPFTIPVCEEKDVAPQLPPLIPIDPESLGRGDLEQSPDTNIQARGLPQPPLVEKENPTLTIEAPTPQSRCAEVGGETTKDPGHLAEPNAGSTFTSHRLATPDRGHSRVHHSQPCLINDLSQSESPQLRPTTTDYFGKALALPKMQQRKKIWVKRPGSSATQVIINEEDLVDDVRDMILKKYANSLGRNFDSPDVTLRIIHRRPSGRHSQTERVLGPEESVSKILEIVYPDGQTVEEALIIDVPQRRTPRHSPHLAMPYYLHDDLRPRENGTDYFPPMPLQGSHSPHLPSSLSVSSAQGVSHHPVAHSIGVLATGQIPNLPSPGARIARHSQHRPKYGRQHTSSPTYVQGAGNPSTHDVLKPSNPQALPTPPIPEDLSSHKAATPPLPRPSSPGLRLKAPITKRSKKGIEQTSATPGSVRDGAVPPINVLIVEDNIINLRLLEAFMKRLKVRWSTAMNGKDAVTKWREGGFHLVLMDIQLPVMNGLDATKEIRRLERVNSIGVFSNSASSTPTFANGDGVGDDRMPDIEDSLMNTALFKSPVIIVALTASSLQSDRHEALAAGCNDFLTKPVNFEWLTRKVMEWGCMQALIDFDGWRKWKDFSQTKAAEKIAGQSTGTGKSPKAVNNRVQAGGGKKEKEKEKLTLASVKEKKASSEDTGTSTDTNGDSGSGNEVVGRL